MVDVSPTPSKQRERRRWEDLPPELLASVAECTTIPDYHRMRAVCRSWASASREVLPRAPLPWIAFLSTTTRNLNLSCNMYSIEEDGRNYDFPLPLSLARSEISCVGTGDGCSCVGTRDGWLVMTSDKHDLNVLLLNPLTGAQIPLPDFQLCIARTVEKIVLSHSPVNDTDDLVAVALYRIGFSDILYAAAANIWSNYRWTHFRRGSCVDVAFDQHGRLFAVTAAGDVYIYPELKQRSTSNFSAGNLLSRYTDDEAAYNEENMKFHLVPTSSGNMLLIFSDTSGSCPKFDVFKVVYQGQGSCLVEIKNLGEQSLFIDKRNCFSLCVRDFPGRLEGNCIYFLQMDCYWKFNIDKEEITKFNIASPIQDQSLYPNWFIHSL